VPSSAGRVLREADFVISSLTVTRIFFSCNHFCSSGSSVIPVLFGYQSVPLISLYRLLYRQCFKLAVESSSNSLAGIGIGCEDLVDVAARIPQTRLVPLGI